MKTFKRTLPILLFVSLASCESPTCDEWTKKDVPNISFQGIVLRKFYDRSNKGEPTIILDNAHMYNLQNSDGYEYLRVGDSIIKKKGTLKYIIKRDSTVFVYYPRCGERIIKE